MPTNRDLLSCPPRILTPETLSRPYTNSKRQRAASSQESGAALGKEVKVLGLGQKVNDREDPCLLLMLTLSLLLPTG